MEYQLTRIPVVVAGMLIRRSVEEVYSSFIDPIHTTQFWFTKSSGLLEAGKTIHWEWEMYGAAVDVKVLKIEPPKQILIQWGPGDAWTMVDFIFTQKSPDCTFISITESGFTGDGDKLTQSAMGSAAGFELVLAGLKAYLEFGIRLNLIADRFPDQIISPYPAK